MCRAAGVGTFWGSQNRLASKIAFGALLETILVDFGTPWHQNNGFPYDFSLHVDDVLYIISGHRFASSGVNVVNFR